MLNIGSLILGVCSWLFAGSAIFSTKALATHKKVILSFSLSAISLILQLCEINRRVLLGDHAAIEDTIRAILIASVVLVSVTIILNLVALVNAKKNQTVFRQSPEKE